MGYMECSNWNSRAKGLEYFKEKRVSNVEKINDNEYKGIVHGTADYNVYLDLLHPRKSTCNCPYANGKRIVCKHKIALYFTINPLEAEEYEKDLIASAKDYYDNYERDHMFDNDEDDYYDMRYSNYYDYDEEDDDDKYNDEIKLENLEKVIDRLIDMPKEDLINEYLDLMTKHGNAFLESYIIKNNLDSKKKSSKSKKKK